MKYCSKIFTLFFFSLCMLCFSTWTQAALPAPKSSTQSLDQIVAVVNNGIITQSEVDAASAAAQQQLIHSGTYIPSESVLKQKVLEHLINQKLQLQIADRLQIKTTPEQVTQAIGRIAKSNHITVAELKQKITKENYTMKQFRKELAKQIRISLLQKQAVAKDISITDEEVNNYIKQYAKNQTQADRYHLNDILIPFSNPNSKEDVAKARRKALAIVKKLKAGANFERIAANLPGNDLGPRTLAQLPNLFAKQVIHMKVNGITKPLKAANGFHILKLIGVQHKSVKLSQNEAEEMLFRQKFPAALNKWLAKVHHTAYIKILVPQ